jgi:nitrate reductase NapE component
MTNGSPQDLEAMLHVADGRPTAQDERRTIEWRSWQVLHYANWASLAVFLVVALWPIVWLRQELRAAAHPGTAGKTAPLPQTGEAVRDAGDPPESAQE